MLNNLYIENIAVIEKTNINFTEGLNILTGETGAGKSIVIDSINAILGNRTSRDLIRNGADSAFVSAEFNDLSSSALNALDEFGFAPEEDGSVLVQRELTLSGKGKCRVNGRPTTVSVLRGLGEYLIDIHGQHASYELMSSELHITYLDKLGNLENDIETYRKAYKEYSRLRSELNKASVDESERNRKTDLLRYQVEELEQADFYVGEYEELTERKQIIENKEKIASALNAAHEYLNGGDETDGAVQQLEFACDTLYGIADCMPETDAVAKRLQNAVYELEDCRDELLSMFDITDAETESLEEIEDRLDLIYTLGKKYGPTIEEMLDFLDKAQQELEYLEKYDENREELINACAKAKKKAEELAKQLSEKRKKISEDFTTAVKQEMTYLDMPNVELVIRQEKCELNQNGCDDIEILISTNPGETPKPVAKIASGGELSRMMLAIKNVLADKDNIDTLIFDEVDTGISGSAAQKVGFKLKEVSRTRQVLCVTHLAQIAALADSHYKIKKSVSDGKTYTDVTPLSHEGRRDELARIIGGVEITQATLDYAEEMLSKNN
ncbi:MAG: DNA repair protein RecN [Clostridia bacterium]|nr:DNA repair protein RecN [Clostridia bacterium]